MKELVYADDTLLIDLQSDVLQLFMECVAEAGKEYGLSFNWKKLEVLPVRTEACIVKPDGTQVTNKDGIIYLSSLLSAGGRITSELGRRLGLAQSDFNALERVWKHATLIRKRKIQIFNACVCTKLSYGLFSAAMTATEQRRLDGFQARCLRRILKIAHAFYSRISNKTVLRLAGEVPLSEKIVEHQQQYLAKLAARDDTDPARRCVFQAGNSNMKEQTEKLRKGRPRMSWIAGLTKRMQETSEII